jgi:hypothetical protein
MNHASLILPHLCCSSPSRHATASTRLDRRHKDATEPNDEVLFFVLMIGHGEQLTDTRKEPAPFARSVTT